MITKLNIDELSTAMQHQKVVDVYSKSLQPVLLLTIDEAFNTRLSIISDAITKLSRDLRILQLEQENQELRTLSYTTLNKLNLLGIQPRGQFDHLWTT